MARLGNRLWLLLAVAWLAAFAYLLPHHLHHDVTWFLLAAERLLDGARLYRDIVEINPPLGIYAAVPAVIAARATGLAPGICYIAFVLGLAAMSLGLAAGILRQSALLPAAQRNWMTAAIFVALVALPIEDFGQREHLTLILCLPYVVLLAARLDGRRCELRLSLIAGALAGIAFAMKPHFALVPLALEALLVFRRRSPKSVLRPELAALAASAIFCVLAVLLAHADYLERIVPFGRLVYDAFEVPFHLVLVQARVVILLPALAVWIAARRAHRSGPWLDASGVAALAFLAAYFAQAKGWGYHLLPALSFGWLAAAGATVAVLQSQAPETPQPKRFAALAMVALVLVATPAMKGAYRNEIADRLSPIVRGIAPDGSLLALSTSLSVGFPLVSDAGLDWASRFPHHWLLPGTLRALRDPSRLDGDRLADLTEIERYARDAVAEDFVRYRPEVVLVDRSDFFLRGLDFDFIRFFSREPRFESLWRDYMRVGEVSFDCGFECRIEIYCRRGATPGCSPGAAQLRPPPAMRSDPERLVGAAVFRTHDTLPEG